MHSIQDDLQISILASLDANVNRAPLRPRPTSVIARLAKLAMDIFGHSPKAAALRPIDKISPLVANAASLVLPLDESDSQVADDSLDPALQELFNLMDDSGLDWPSTVFDDDPRLSELWEV